MKLRGVAATMLVAVIGLSAGLAFSDDEERAGTSDWRADRGGVRPADNPLYAAECSSCHFAYPPGLLPAASWDRIMTGLSDHFGENAELTPEVQALITEYLVGSAAEQDPGKIARGILRGVDAASPPLRITETAYFQRKHDELAPRVWRDNPDVGSMSNCSACHTRAEEGSFDERQVRIPGHGRWED